MTAVVSGKTNSNRSPKTNVASTEGPDWEWLGEQNNKLILWRSVESSFSQTWNGGSPASIWWSGYDPWPTAKHKSIEKLPNGLTTCRTSHWGHMLCSSVAGIGGNLDMLTPVASYWSTTLHITTCGDGAWAGMGNWDIVYPYNFDKLHWLCDEQSQCWAWLCSFPELPQRRHWSCVGILTTLLAPTITWWVTSPPLHLNMNMK